MRSITMYHYTVPVLIKLISFNPNYNFLLNVWSVRSLNFFNYNVLGLVLATTQKNQNLGTVEAA